MKYEILNVIDQGAYGIVYRVRSRQTDCIYAMKKFKDPTNYSKSISTLIGREIRMLQNLKSPYLVKMKEIFEKNGHVYILFELMGTNLLKVIETNSPNMKISQIVRVIYFILKGLEYLHNKNIIHRDIKPQNVLASPDLQTIKLCDFGFSTFSNDEDKKKLTAYVATRWYRSPEMLLGEGYGKPADVWALGCIICEMVDGNPLFPGNDTQDQIYLVSSVEDIEQRPLFKRYKMRTGKKLAHFIELSLKYHPEERITVREALKLPLFKELQESNTDYLQEPGNLTSHNRYKSVPVKAQSKINNIYRNPPPPLQLLPRQPMQANSIELKEYNQGNSNSYQTARLETTATTSSSPVKNLRKSSDSLPLVMKPGISLTETKPSATTVDSNIKAQLSHQSLQLADLKNTLNNTQRTKTLMSISSSSRERDVKSIYSQGLFRLRKKYLESSN